MKLTDIKINGLAECELEIEGEIASSDFELYRSKALKALGEEVKIDGFRPGHIPEKVLSEQVGEDKILMEMAEQAIAETYPEILRDNKIAALGRPEVTITKIAPNNPLGFKIKTAVMPEIKIGDYRAIAKKFNTTPEEKIEIDEEEVSKVIDDIRKSRVSADHSHHEHKEGEKCEHEETLPELNDEFAQSLGQFKTVDELKAKIKENLALEKKNKAKDKKRVGIVEEIIKESEIKIPKLLIESEKDKMMAEMEGQIGYMGLNFEDYLSHLKKTKEELREGWEKPARERVAFGLVLNEIATKEKIEAPADELKNEMDYLKTQYKDVPEERLHSYATGLIINEKVFEYLENLK